MSALLASAGEGLDMCELCGGEARTTQLAIRRRLTSGRNFDLVCNVVRFTWMQYEIVGIMKTELKFHFYTAKYLRTLEI